MVEGSKTSVVGYSKYSAGSYDKKFKNAVFVAIINNESNHHRKVRYDKIYNYKLLNHGIAYIGKKPIKAKRGVNRRLHNEIIAEQENRRIKYINKRDKNNKSKREDKIVSKKQAYKELYGDGKMKSKQKTSRIDYDKLTKKQLIALLKKRK